MKTIFKTSYIILGGTLLLSSCTQEEAPAVRPDSSDRRIVFHTSLPGLTTKATEIVTDLPHFYMTAFDESDNKLIENGKLKEYFNNVRVEKKSGSDKAISDQCIWPEPGQESDKLHFFAYYPELTLDASLVNGTSVSGNDITIGYKIDGFKVAPNIANQVDFVTAYATGSMADNLFSGINLNFRHQLSRIEVKAWGANKSCDIEIAGVRIGGVNVNGNFNFKPSEGTSVWAGQKKGTVEHIFQDEEIIILSTQKNSHATLETAASIIGANLGAEINCAMVIPTTDETGWDFSNDRTNSAKGTFISVLLRVIDKTSTDGKQQYPYDDNDMSHGPNALNIPIVFLAVDGSGKVTDNPGQLYKGNDGVYYTDNAKQNKYNVPSGSIVKEFGWAALPIECKWEAGYYYTYTLDYSSGVGLHDPSVAGEGAPKAGDPIISDIIGVNLDVKEWKPGEQSGFEVPGS